METSFVIPLALLLLSALIGVVIKQNARQSDKTDEVGRAVNDQRVTLARVDGVVGGLSTRVDELHRWKNDLQQREASELKRTIETMRRERGMDA